KVEKTNLDNFGFNKLNQGMINSSWESINGSGVDEVVTIRFKALANGRISQALSVGSQLTNAEAYDENLDVMDVELRVLESDQTFALFQNTPNPFLNSTEISFTLPRASKTRLTVYDVTGKQVKVMNNHYSAGRHSITLHK